MQIKLKLSILSTSGTFVMGPGPLRLLENISRHNSINKAAKQMRLSYVKALTMIKGLEKGLGQQMVIRSKGGNNRGGAQLTPFAKTYVDQYIQLEERIKQHSEKEFNRFQDLTQGEDAPIDKPGDDNGSPL